MTKRYNYGTGNNLGIIGVALIGNFFGLFLFICFLIWLPIWMYIAIVIAIVAYFIVKESKQKEADDKQLLQKGE